MLFRVDRNRFSLWFTCNRKLNKLQTFTEKSWDDSVEITVQLLRYKNDKSTVSVCAWKKDLTKSESNGVTAVYANAPVLILDQKIPYVKNNKYHIDFNFEKLKKPIKHTWAGNYKILLKQPTMNVYIKFTADEEDENDNEIIYTCEKMMHPKVAKKEFKILRKAKLVGKPHWDRHFDTPDICCHACNEPGKKVYEALSNPSYGRVYRVQHQSNYNFFPKENGNSNFFFKYKNNVYQKLENQELLTFYSKKDYDAYIKKLGYEEGHFKTFEELFNIELTQEEINSNGNVIGGAYRLEKTYLKETGDLLWNECIKAKDFGTEKDWKELERLGVATKVVTNAVHSSYPTGSEFCPVCKMMHRIAHSGYHWEGLPLRLKEVLYWTFVYKLKSFFKVLEVKIADAKYDRKHPNES